MKTDADLEPMHAAFGVVDHHRFRHLKSFSPVVHLVFHPLGVAKSEDEPSDRRPSPKIGGAVRDDPHGESEGDHDDEQGTPLHQHGVSSRTRAVCQQGSNVGDEVFHRRALGVVNSFFAGRVDEE